MLLLASKHARIGLGCELDELLVVSLDLVQLLACELLGGAGATANARLCHHRLSSVCDVSLHSVLVSR